MTKITRLRGRVDPVTGAIDPLAAGVADIGQTIDFAADKHGIRADAETLIGSIPLGLLWGADTFHVFLDRPFLFFVRENTTGALLLAGALMDTGTSSHQFSSKP